MRHHHPTLPAVLLLVLWASSAVAASTTTCTLELPDATLTTNTRAVGCRVTATHVTLFAHTCRLLPASRSEERGSLAHRDPLGFDLMRWKTRAWLALCDGIGATFSTTHTYSRTSHPEVLP